MSFRLLLVIKRGLSCVVNQSCGCQKAVILLHVKYVDLKCCPHLCSLCTHHVNSLLTLICKQNLGKVLLQDIGNVNENRSAVSWGEQALNSEWYGMFSVRHARFEK